MRSAARAGHHALSAVIALLLSAFICFSSYRTLDGGMTAVFAILALATLVSWRAPHVTAAQGTRHG
jgi:hypothetical protein